MDGIIVAIITGSFSFATFLLTRYFTIRDKKKEQERAEDEKYKELEKREKKNAEDVKSLSNSISQILEYQKKTEKTFDVLSKSLRDSLRNDIIGVYNRYYEEKKYMPIYERENLSHMAEEYYDLDGNGVIPTLVERLNELGTEPPKE